MDVQTVIHISQIFLVIAGFCVTTFPLLYGLYSPWYRSPLGRAVLLQSVAVALAIDLSIIGQFWTITTDPTFILVINVSVLSFVALASVYLTIQLIIYNWFHRENEEHEVE